MTNFIVQHRNNNIIYNTIDEAKKAIEGIDGVDSEIVIARYYDKEDVRSVLGVCKKMDGDEKCTWTTFSYDDLLLERVIPKDGEDGQILTKTEDGAKWSNNVNFWKGTLEDYNKITDKDDDCIYFVVGDISDDE